MLTTQALVSFSSGSRWRSKRESKMLYAERPFKRKTGRRKPARKKPRRRERRTVRPSSLSKRTSSMSKTRKTLRFTKSGRRKKKGRPKRNTARKRAPKKKMLSNESRPSYLNLTSVRWRRSSTTRMSRSSYRPMLNQTSITIGSSKKTKKPS